MTVMAGEAAESFSARAAQGASGRARRAAAAAPGYYAGQARGISVPGGSRYQTAILAEFLVAALIVAFAPIAAGAPDDGKGGPSPYRVGDLGQLAAIGVTYFILALFSAGWHARLAAWFGGLVLLAVLFKKTLSGQLTAEVRPLQGKGQ